MFFDRAPGIIGEIARFSRRGQHRKSQPELAVASALSIASVICSRKFTTGEGNLTSGVYPWCLLNLHQVKKHGAKNH